MEIICPECQFSREVPDDKVPATSVNATCPQCGIKFRFRDLPPQEPEFTLEAEPEATETVAESSSVEEPQTPAAQEVAVAPEQEQAKAEEPTPVPAAKHAQQPQAENDIWQKLDDMGEDAPGTEQETANLEDISVDVPFEDLEKHGFFGGVWETTKRAMLAPMLFFTTMPLGKSPRSSIIYYILISEFGLVFQSVWDHLGFTAFNLYEQEAAQAADVAFSALITQQLLYLIVLAPMMLFAGVYIMSGLIHLMLKLTGAANEDFATTLRVNCYSNSANILYVFPFIGFIVAFFWQMAINVVGLKCAHKTTWGRVILAYAIPLAILFALGMFVALSDKAGVQTF